MDSRDWIYLDSEIAPHTDCEIVVRYWTRSCRLEIYLAIVLPSKLAPGKIQVSRLYFCIKLICYRRPRFTGFYRRLMTYLTYSWQLDEKPIDRFHASTTSSRQFAHVQSSLKCARQGRFFTTPNFVRGKLVDEAKLSVAEKNVRIILFY